MTFKVGDVVTWQSPSRYWQGGKAKVIALTSEQFGDKFIDVEVLEPVPDNHENSRVGSVIAEYTSSLKLVPEPVSAVEHPAHYGGKDNPYEVIKVAEAWGLDKDAYLFNVLKYIARAGKKGAVLEDLRKGHFYLGRKITNLVKASK